MLNIQITTSTPNGTSIDSIVTEIENFCQKYEKNLGTIAEFVKQGVQEDLDKGIDIFGNPVKPLAPSTIARKGHSRPFYDSGDLLKSVLMQKQAINEYIIFIDANRSKIMSILNQEREAFGLSKSASDNIDKFLNSL